METEKLTFDPQFYRVRQTPKNARKHLLRNLDLRLKGVPIAERTVSNLERKMRGEAVESTVPRY